MNHDCPDCGQTIYHGSRLPEDAYYKDDAGVYRHRNCNAFKEAARAADTHSLVHKANNPNNEPTGHYTGRCGNCGSKNLWDDNSAYGCNDCGKFWCF